MGDPVALLRQRIDESGLSVRDFAHTVVMRDERTVYRWLSSESPMPQPVLEWLERDYRPGETA